MWRRLFSGIFNCNLNNADLVSHSNFSGSRGQSQEDCMRRELLSFITVRDVKRGAEAGFLKKSDRLNILVIAPYHWEDCGIPKDVKVARCKKNIFF
ncbi:hypothetical protein PROFUN_09477 [Planoprotostelium fungivorum]|uniref:Uncharacterized protein n=1 Tax=Planoprotostelium fungivorum TaxID=1890364 RepID=A0A2P6NH33_9EUKA|nr:hypothetical protein PROFUN_09477 [Planoprotostelium fungivorum]